MGVLCCNEASSPRKKTNIQYDEIIPKIIENKIYTKNELDLIMNKFIDQTIINNGFYDYNDNDESFNSQKQYEKKELNKFFELNKDKIKNQISQALNLTNANLENSNLNINKLISDLINIENGQKVCSEKIERIIESDGKDNNKKKNRINILVIGKQGIGKKTLVNKIFKLKNIIINFENNFNQEIQEYESEKLPFFKFILIKFDNNFQFSFNDYKNRIMNYIKNQYQTNNKNNYINCIWYCFTNGFLNMEELELIKSLNDSYNKMIPVILVHTMSPNIQQILNAVSNFNINQEDLVILLAEDFFSQFNGLLKSYGVDFLIIKTLEKYKNTFSLYDDEMTNDILISIKSQNEDICKSVNEQIIKNFVNEYNFPKEKEDFVEYLTDIFRLNIKYFLTKIMSEQSINRINSEYTLIQSMFQFIQFYEKDVLMIMEPTINSFVAGFIEQQKKMEIIEKKSNDQLKKYLIDNYNYIFQKHYIYEILYKKYGFFCEYFKKELDNLSEQIIFNKNINMNKFQQLEKDVKDFFAINNMINNNFANNNDNNNKSLDISMMNGTFINDNQMNNAMNVQSENNYVLINNMNSPNNMNCLNNFNNINNINSINNNIDDQTVLNLPSRTEVEMNANAHKLGASNIYPNI